ncbi:hypothetical protein BT69DRAFT_1285637, partial [Atractiella rhizophila]
MCDDDFGFCICISLGCSDQISQEGDQTPRWCPRCRNASVTGAKKSKKLEICCVPLCPISSSYIWYCPICNWEADQSGPAPPVAQGGPPMMGGYAPQQPMGWGGPPPPAGYNPQMQGGYGGPP